MVIGKSGKDSYLLSVNGYRERQKNCYLLSVNGYQKKLKTKQQTTDNRQQITDNR